MCIAAAMAGVAGALAAPLVRTYPYMGHSVIVTAFIVTIVGGARQSGRRRGGGDSLRIRAHVRDHVRRRRRRGHRRSAADAAGAHRASDGAVRGPGSGLIPGSGVAHAGNDSPLEVLGDARRSLCGPRGAAAPAQLLPEGSRGLPRHQRSRRGELPVVDAHRRVVARSCRDDGCRRLREHAAREAAWRPGSAGDAAGRRNRRSHCLDTELSTAAHEGVLLPHRVVRGRGGHPAVLEAPARAVRRTEGHQAHSVGARHRESAASR